MDGTPDNGRIHKSEVGHGREVGVHRHLIQDKVHMLGSMTVAAEIISVRARMTKSATPIINGQIGIEGKRNGIAMATDRSTTMRVMFEIERHTSGQTDFTLRVLPKEIIGVNIIDARLTYVLGSARWFSGERAARA